MAEKKKLGKRLAIGAITVIVILAAIFVLYVNDYSRADEFAMAAAEDVNGSADGVTVRQIDGDALAFVPEHPKAGFVFYPGAKVQPEAYAAFLTRCARKGVLCVLVKPPFNLAILDVNAAQGIREQFPEVHAWMIGGHSMGGVAASNFAARNNDKFNAVVLLASYPADDLSEFDGKALSVVGTEDGVLNRERYDDAADQMPADTTEIEIEGGNHANFGNYGEQASDNPSTITRESQQEQTAELIAALAE